MLCIGFAAGQWLREHALGSAASKNRLTICVVWAGASAKLPPSPLRSPPQASSHAASLAVRECGPVGALHIRVVTLNSDAAACAMCMRAAERHTSSAARWCVPAGAAASCGHSVPCASSAHPAFDMKRNACSKWLRSRRISDRSSLCSSEPAASSAGAAGAAGCASCRACGRKTQQHACVLSSSVLAESEHNKPGSPCSPLEVLSA
jgi:hypothetical protein